MNLWKRNAVISVIVLFVCVALYLSWSYGREPESEAPVFDPGVPQSTAPVIADGDVDKTESADYFAEARLTRQQARDISISILNDAATRTDASQGIKDNAAGEIEKLASNALTEVNIENLVIAKGYANCVAFINQEGISLVVAAPEGGLTDTDAAKITDIVIAQSTLSALDIKILEVEV